MPKMKRCACGSKIGDFQVRCVKCCTVCRCGRRIDYSGRGRPRSQCERCEELRFDRRVCPCGTPLIKSQRVYCSARCSREGRHIRNGAAPRDGWRDHVVTALEQERLDCDAAFRIAVWLLAYSDLQAYEVGTAVVFPKSETRFEARWTTLDFSRKGDLPQWVAVDDKTRFSSMEMLQPELYGYALSNSKRDTIAVTSALPHMTARWRERRCFVPRYAGYDVELAAPSESFEIHSLEERLRFKSK